MFYRLHYLHKQNLNPTSHEQIHRINQINNGFIVYTIIKQT